jgi:hypothetical protein
MSADPKHPHTAGDRSSPKGGLFPDGHRAESAGKAPSTKAVAPSTTTVDASTRTVEGSATTKARATIAADPSTKTVKGSTASVEGSTTTVQRSARAAEGPTDDEEGPDNASPGVDSVADGTVRLVPQAEQLKNPGFAITLDASAAHLPRLGAYSDCYHGITTTDYSRFGRVFWEMVASDIGDRWVGQQSTVESTRDFGGCSNLLLWENNGAEVQQMRRAGATVVVTGLEAWGRDGVVISQMNSLSVTRYGGSAFDTNVAIVVPKKAELLPAIWAFLSDPSFAPTVRRFNQKVVVEYVYFPTMPFDLTHWQKVAAEKYPNGLPEPQSDDPTQWLFHGHPAKAEPATVLQVAAARLTGYRWPAELDETMRLAPEARACVDKCKDLAPFADDDGVVPLVPMRGEPAAEGRVRDLLRTAFGGEWSGAKEATLLAAANTDKAPADNLDDWLKNRFFAEHCTLFHNRPFVWHIWDGRKKDGFGVLVHYHRLAAPNGEGRRLLEKITHGYLGDWIARQRDEMKANKAGADARLAAALDLQKKLEAILAGEPPYDIFIRWKPLHEQPIGWEPDINDGVRMNIRPFIEAGVLRDKVNVKWTKDRGQEPQALRPKTDFPWFWSGSTFSGDRVNDVHLSVAEKQKAREAKGLR